MCVFGWVGEHAFAYIHSGGLVVTTHARTHIKQPNTYRLSYFQPQIIHSSRLLLLFLLVVLVLVLLLLLLLLLAAVVTAEQQQKAARPTPHVLLCCLFCFVYGFLVFMCVCTNVHCPQKQYMCVCTQTYIHCPRQNKQTTLLNNLSSLSLTTNRGSEGSAYTFDQSTEGVGRWNLAASGLTCCLTRVRPLCMLYRLCAFVKWWWHSL